MKTIWTCLFTADHDFKRMIDNQALECRVCKIRQPYFAKRKGFIQRAVAIFFSRLHEKLQGTV